MECREDEERPRQSLIAPEILSLPAREVLSYCKVRDPLSLRLNIVGALKNWKDVADSLGYPTEQILGLFAHDARPGLVLLEDWMYKKNGRLGRLVDVLTDLQLYACLEVIDECVEEYETTLGKGNRPSEVDDNDNDFSDPQRDQEGFGHNSNTAPSSMSSTTSASSTNISSSDFNTISTEQTTSITSECSTTSSLPHSSQYVAAMSSKALDKKIDNPESGSADCKELQEKCLSSDGLNDRGDSAVKRPDLFRFKSWSPNSEGEVNGGKSESGKDGRSPINRSVSHEANRKKSKERKKSLGKKFIHFISKRRKKSAEPSSKEEKPGTGESNFDSCRETSMVASGSYREDAPRRSENLAPLKVKEARRVSLADSLSSAESIASPISPGYESGYMSEGPSVSSGKTISIIHCCDLEGEAFREEVLKLYNRFGCSLGYRCHLDKLELIQIAEHKFRYALKSVQQSDFLFICVSPELKRIFDSPPEEISDSLEADEQCMLRLESDLILADLAVHASNRKGKFMTIMLEGSSKSDVPCFLNLFMKYHWPKDDRKIRCMIEGQPEIVPAPVSNVKTDPPPLVVKPAKVN